ncbi:MAG: FAD-dependent oxidoreductase [Proteobacteria bacterium]|nr:FAD-dependent oxidoreductase [Pseudomonadota bacterium]
MTPLHAIASGARTARIMVVGAGVVGVATAWALARRGHRVTIVDQRSGPGEGTSFANGAQLSYAYTDALASSALLKRMPGLLVGADPAFRLSLHADLSEIRWLLRFLRQCSSAAFEANTLAGLELGLESRAALHALLDRHPLEFAHAIPGKLHLHETAAGFAAACALADVKRRHGAEQLALSPAEAVAIEPAIGERRARLTGAIYSPQDAVGDPHRFCIALTDLLVRVYGMEPWFDVAVAGVTLSGGEMQVTFANGRILVADHVVFCTGMAPPIAPLRTALAGRVMPMKGYSFTADPGAAAPRVSITDVARKIVFCRLGDKVRVAGLAQLGRRDQTVDPADVAALIAAARAALPGAAAYDSAFNFWAGHRPMTANSLPVIQAIAPGLSVNLGHGMLGWTYAMGSAERAADLVGEMVSA